MYKLSVLAATVAVANGFSHGAAPLPRAAVRGMPAVRMAEEAGVAEKAEETEAATEAAPAVEYAESLPMLVKRPQLKGYAGDVGFDPVGFSEIFPMVRAGRPWISPDPATAVQC